MNPKKEPKYVYAYFDMAPIFSLDKNRSGNNIINICVYSRMESGNYNNPHFHFYNERYARDFLEKSKTRPLCWKDKDSLSKKESEKASKYLHGCIYLDKAEYYSHGDAWDILPDNKTLNELIKKLKEPTELSYLIHKLDYWQYACFWWNHSIELRELPNFKRVQYLDEEMPDYSILRVKDSL